MKPLCIEGCGFTLFPFGSSIKTLFWLYPCITPVLQVEEQTQSPIEALYDSIRLVIKAFSYLIDLLANYLGSAENALYAVLTLFLLIIVGILIYKLVKKRADSAIPPFQEYQGALSQHSLTL